MIERMEMIIYIEKCREKESRKDAERERLTERQCVCHYLSLPEHTLMNKSSTISNEETRNSVCVFVCVFVCADMCMRVVTSGETGHRMYLSFPVYHPGTSSGPHCHGNLSTHTHPPPAPHTHTHTHTHTHKHVCTDTHTHTDSHTHNHTTPYTAHREFRVLHGNLSPASHGTRSRERLAALCLSFTVSSHLGFGLNEVNLTLAPDQRHLSAFILKLLFDPLIVFLFINWNTNLWPVKLYYIITFYFPSTHHLLPTTIMWRLWERDALFIG